LHKVFPLLVLVVFRTFFFLFGSVDELRRICRFFKIRFDLRAQFLKSGCFVRVNQLFPTLRLRHGKRSKQQNCYEM